MEILTQETPFKLL